MMIRFALSHFPTLFLSGAFFVFLAAMLAGYQWLGPYLFQCRFNQKTIDLIVFRFITLLKIKYEDVVEVGHFHYSKFFRGFKWRRAHLSLNFISKPFAPRVFIQLPPHARYNTVVLTPPSAERFIHEVKARQSKTTP